MKNVEITESRKSQDQLKNLLKEKISNSTKQQTEIERLKSDLHNLRETISELSEENEKANATNRDLNLN